MTPRAERSFFSQKNRKNKSKLKIAPSLMRGDKMIGFVIASENFPQLLSSIKNV